MDGNLLKPALPKSLYGRIEEDVVNLHIELDLELPVDPYLITRKLGFIVRRFSEINNTEAFNIFKTGPDESRDGLSYRDPELDTFVIWINDLDSTYEPRLNFTIMHEIGHIRMGHRGDSPLAEMIANYYAAYALVPSPLPALLDCSSFIDISDEFNVSVDCAYICSKRCMNWVMYGGPIKPYEQKLIEYYQKKLNQIGGDEN